MGFTKKTVEVKELTKQKRQKKEEDETLRYRDGKEDRKEE